MSLTSELKNARSAVGRWMREQLPWTKDVMAEFRLGAPDLQVPAPAANPGTTGGAFDWRVRFLVDPSPDLRIPVRVAARLGGGMERATLRLVEQVGGRAPERRAAVGATPPVDAGPVPNRDEDLLLRACWVLSLLTELYRAGPLIRSPLDTVGGAPTTDDLLHLAPSAAINDLRALTQLATSALVPPLRSWGQPVYVGPEFAGSRYIRADADVIAGGVLVEVKTSLGKTRADGSRYCVLDTQTLQQMLGYTLLDLDDRYEVHSVALYAARYGYLVTWRLGDLMPRLAGRETTVKELRTSFESMVRTEMRR